MNLCTSVRRSRAVVAAALVFLLAGCASVGPGVAAAAGPACPTIPVSGTSGPVAQLELVGGGQVATAVLNDTATATSLLGQLPMVVRLRDSFAVAMVGETRTPLATGADSTSCGYAAGDIGYSIPDRTIAIFHSDQPGRLAPPGVVLLGTVTGGLAALTSTGGVQVTIRRVG